MLLLIYWQFNLQVPNAEHKRVEEEFLLQLVKIDSDRFGGSSVLSSICGAFVSLLCGVFDTDINCT